jgi:hypothetical protein
MEINLLPSEDNLSTRHASEYRRIFGRSLMALTKLRGETAASNELCHVTAVDRVSPNLWVTVKFLDGSKRGLRPEELRLATFDESSSPPALEGSAPSVC